MNLLSTIIDRLNQRIEVGNIFDQIYGLSELAADGNDKAWIHYIGNGQAIPVTNFDAKQGTLFWAKRGKISVAKIETFKLAGCKSMYETRYSLSANAVVRKSHLPCDSADAQDWIASRVLKLISGTDPQFKTAIGVVSYEVVPNGYTNEIKSLPANYEWASVTIDVDINVVSGSEDGCYDTCATGDIPLPDFEPCTPCLTEVAVDGVTITGNGTPADPLVAIGGGGGTPLRTQDEGVNVSTNTTTLNFTGAGVTASLTSLGVVEVNVPGGGGGGGVTSVTGTAPIASSGGATPDISISQADATTDGYLSSADWATFDGKQDQLTAGTGINITGVTIDNTAPDQIVSITGGTDISVTGTYPNFTIDNTADLTGYVPYTGATQDVDLGTYKITTDAVEFSLTPTNSPGPGQIAYVGNTGALAYNLNGSAVTSQIGQTIHAFVHNADSVTITKGQAVYLFGASGNKASVKLANNTADATSAKTFGLAAEDISSGQNGFITVQGVLDGLNTGSYTAGDTLYLGATAGSLTATKPYAPNHLVYIGVVEKANNGNGQIYVRVQNGYELDEIHDVDLITTPPANNDFLVYTTGVNNLWKNKSIGTVLGGTTSQYVRGDGTLATFPSVLLQSGRFAWLTQLFEHTQGLIYSIEYVAAYDKIFVGGIGNNVSIFSATTGELLSTVVITTVQRIRYIASINEIWTTSSTTAIITRISPVTNTSLGTITTSVVANGWEILEYSSTKVFITIANSGGSILVVNPTTLAVTATITTGVPSFPSGMALNNNVASAQYDRIVVAANLGVAILNPTTNTITATIVNPSSAFSGGRDIIYSPTDDKYYAASQVNHRIICLNIASATTFTLNKIKYNAYQVIGLQIDETNDLLMFTQLASATTNLLGVFCSFIQKSTFDSYTNIVTNLNGGGSGIAGPIKLDATNKRVFVAGTQSAGRSVITVKYL